MLKPPESLGPETPVDKVRVGILQTDSVLEKFQPQFGDYPQMFERVLHNSAQTMGLQVECVNYPVQSVLPSTMDCDAYLITGSRDSVYDDLPWIFDLVKFLEGALVAGKQVLGICFGHQLMAHFFGGRVAPAEGGWAVGVHTSEIVAAAKLDGREYRRPFQSAVEPQRPSGGVTRRC